MNQLCECSFSFTGVNVDVIVPLLWLDWDKDSAQTGQLIVLVSRTFLRFNCDGAETLQTLSGCILKNKN